MRCSWCHFSPQNFSYSFFSFVIVLVRFACCNFYFYIVFVLQIAIILVFVLTEQSAIILVFVTKIALSDTAGKSTLCDPSSGRRLSFAICLSVLMFFGALLRRYYLRDISASSAIEMYQ